MSLRSLSCLAAAGAALALAGCAQPTDAQRSPQEDATTGSLLHQKYQAGEAGNNSSSYTQPFVELNGK